MLALINVFTPVKVEEAAEEVGLDEILHGEQAYELTPAPEKAAAAAAGAK